ncbi:MAG: OmpH family outer membrane protein [Planctomycetota bacterium]|nr:MAG: OmpH family outer membrane protein [Planctomycetota bacterium]
MYSIPKQDSHRVNSTSQYLEDFNMIVSVRALLLTVILGAASISPALAVDPSTVAVINLERVFEESRLVAQRSAQLREVGQEVQQRLEAMTEELKNIETELQIRPSSHPRYAEFKERFEVAKLRRDLYRERQSERLQRREMELLKQSYDDMVQLIQEYARSEGFALVLLNAESDLEASNIQSLRLQLAQRVVLYRDSSLDRTTGFITFANSRFRGGDENDEGDS